MDGILGKITQKCCVFRCHTEKGSNNVLIMFPRMIKEIVVFLKKNEQTAVEWL